MNMSKVSLAQIDFNDQVDAFLADPVYDRESIARDEAGTITASRCVVHMDNVDLEYVNEQLMLCNINEGSPSRKPAT